MIKFYPKQRIFLLSGKSVSYAIHVNKVNMLQHSYFGGKLREEDAACLCKFSDGLSPRPDDTCWEMGTDNVPCEMGAFARGDFREPTLIVEREKGDAMSYFCYESYEIFDGVPQWEGIPHARNGGKTLAITTRDKFSSVEVVLYYSVWDDLDVIARNLVVKNVGETQINLVKVFSFCIDLPMGKYSTMRLGGRWGGERMTEVAPLPHGVTRLHSLRGSSSHMTNPFMGILTQDCKEENGECYGVQLCYSGSFAITAESAETTRVRIQGGINEVNFGWKLKKGEQFVTPQAFLCYSNEGMGGLSRSYSDFIREQILRPNFAKQNRPVVINNWEATYLDFSREKLLPIVDAAAELGMDTFVLDDGWFGARVNLMGGLGDWVCNEEKLAGGLKGLSDYCTQKGLKFGLWFEPEMINENSDLYRTHPDWVIQKKGVFPCRSRDQLVLDFSRQDVIDNIFEQMRKVISENNVAYIKWDMNRNITDSYSEALPANRQGEFMHRYILGVYQLLERLVKEFPNLMMEGCASGGGRYDSGMLYYFPQIWTSDVTDGFERTKIQWGTSMCYPLSSMSCHVSVCPNHQTGRTTPFFTRGAVASLGATGYELDLSKLTDEEKKMVKEQITQYKQVEDIILCGDLYRLRSPFDTNFFCEMVVSKDKSRAYIVGETIHGLPFMFCEHMKLCGLAKDKIYYVPEIDLKASGDALMNLGIPLPCIQDYHAWIWNVIEVTE